MCTSDQKRNFWFYTLAIVIGVVAGIAGGDTWFAVGKFCSDVFLRLFRCVSMPMISLSVIVALMHSGENRAMQRVWKKTLCYTLLTTLAAVTVSAFLYTWIQPANMGKLPAEGLMKEPAQGSYTQYLLQIFPDNLLGAFLQYQVLTVLLMSVVVGLSIRKISQEEARATIQHFFEGFHSILFTIIRGMVRWLPIGLFGFITVGVREWNGHTSLHGMGAYVLLVTSANLLQGFLVLPIFLCWKKQNPARVFQKMLPALSVAFFTKSSAGTLPVTIQQAETKLCVHPSISRFVLPLCTTVNMNGCGAFIFITVLYGMQNHGVTITPWLMLPWIFIATLAAVGNAGVPMGCFFLSASLLSSMNVPLDFMGWILPMYTLMDMLETALNVWSDACVTVAVNEDVKGSFGSHS